MFTSNKEKKEATLSNKKFYLLAVTIVVIQCSVAFYFIYNMERPNHIKVLGDYKTSADAPPVALSIQEESVVFNGYQYNVDYTQIDDNSFIAKTSNQVISVKYSDETNNKRRLDVEVWKINDLSTDEENTEINASDLATRTPKKTKFVFWTSE